MCPFSLDHNTSDLLQLWRRLPAPHRQRLLGLRSQRLEQQLSAAAAPGEDRDASTPRPCGGTVGHREILPRHWERWAVVDGRQSTLPQVLEQQEAPRLP